MPAVVPFIPLVVGALSAGAQLYSSSEQMSEQKRIAAQQAKEKAIALAQTPALAQPAPMAADPAGTTPLLGTNVSPLLGMPAPDLKETPAQGLAAPKPEEDPLKKQQQGGMSIGT
jgi:type IV secretory pathway VirJ component